MSSPEISVPFQRVAIIGTGLIGGSFALALREHFPEVKIVGLDRPEIARQALARGAVQDIATDIAGAVRNADLIYVALPISGILDALSAIAAHAKPTALVTDTGSTKAAICREAAKHFGRGARFLGGHPIAGKENSGIEHADSKLFQRSPYALIGASDGGDPRVQAFARIIQVMGARAIWCDAEKHDWAVGIASHLPQMLAVALANVAHEATDEMGLPLSLAGPGARDMLRLAGSSFGVWRDITHTNSKNIAGALDQLAQAVDHLRTNLTTKELEQEFRTANEVYRKLQKRD